MEEADELYALAPEDFVAARNALAKRLRKEGRRDAAAAVIALRRPSVAAWALNQVARTEPALVATAIEAGAELRTASEGAGAGDPSGLRAATKAERQAAIEVVQAAAAHLGGRVDAQRSALLATLRVAALDAAVADQLGRGVLSADQDQPGFGFGLDVEDSPAAPRPRRAPVKRSADRKTTLRAVPDLEPDHDDADARADAERAQAEEAKADAKRAKAERAAERLRIKERADRRRTAERLAREAARLVKAAEAAEAEAQEARAEADRAVEAAMAAGQAVDDD